METGKPRKHRSLLAEYLNKLEARIEPIKVGDKEKVSAPADENPAPVPAATVQGKPMNQPRILATVQGKQEK